MMKQTVRKLLCLLLTVMLLLPIIGPATVQASSYRVGDTFFLGQYPQSRVTNISTINSLSILSPNASWNTYRYYSGNGSIGSMSSGDWMEYCDIAMDGAMYRGVRFSQYRPIRTHEPSNSDNSRQDDNGYYVNNTYWFVWEPLKWRVLDASSGLVTTSMLIDAQPFSNTHYLINGVYYQTLSLSSYANKYETSTIRRWLRDFYREAFSSSDQRFVNYTTIDNNACNGCPEQYSGDPTRDDVFLLSYSEASSLIGASAGTDYAKCQGLYTNGGSSEWILRSAGVDSIFVGWLTDSELNNNGGVDRTDRGIRPAMCVNLNAIPSQEYYKDGYNTTTDRYNFSNLSGNDSEANITPKTFWTDLFGDKKGAYLNNKYPKLGDGGHCFGMAQTTAATLMGCPKVTDYYDGINIFHGHSNLFEISPDSNNYELDMTARKYIQYSHYYQLSSTVQRQIEQNTSVKSAYDAVYDYVFNDGPPVILFFAGKDDAAKDSNHWVLAVGLTNHTIIVDDSNVPDNLTSISIDSSITANKWSYQPLPEDHPKYAEYRYDDSSYNLCFTTDSLGTYLYIMYAMHPNYDSNENAIGNAAGFASGEYLDADKLLVIDESDSFSCATSDAVSIQVGGGSEANAGKCYWINREDEIACTNEDENKAEIAIVGTEKAYSISLPGNSEISASMLDNDDNMQITIKSDVGEEASISIDRSTGENNDVLTLSGICCQDDLVVETSNNGLSVSGLNGIVVDYSVNESSNQASANVIDGREVNITINNSNNTVTTDYVPEEHVTPVEPENPSETEGRCRYCGKVHGDSFWDKVIAFIHVILYFLSTLFG